MQKKNLLPPGTTGLGPKGEDGTTFLDLGGVALYGPSPRVTLAYKSRLTVSKKRRDNAFIIIDRPSVHSSSIERKKNGAKFFLTSSKTCIHF